MCNVGPRAWQCVLYSVPAGRSGFSHLLSHLAHRWSKGETCASVTRLCAPAFQESDLRVDTDD